MAGVGTMTVSRVLNSSARVSDETRERVHSAIAQLNYKPNLVARSLRRARSNSVGLIVPNFYDPFFATCAHAFSLVAKAHHYSVSVTTSDEDAAIEFTEANLMVLNNVEGLAVIPAAIGRSSLSRPEFEGLPIVTLDRPVAGHAFNCVLVQNRKGARIAVEHLIDHGHQRIAYLGLSDKLYTLDARYGGYRKAILNAGLSPSEHLTCVTEAQTLAIIRQQLSGHTPVTAFFMGNNLVMRHALHAFATLGLHIPRDVAISGFDDFQMADIFKPGITVVQQPAQELGRVAAELLFQRITARNTAQDTGGNMVADHKRIVLPVQHIIRQSCGCNQS